MTGKLKYKLANSVLGAIITHALVSWSNSVQTSQCYFDLISRVLLNAWQVNEAGSHIVAAESGDLLYWDMATRKVVHLSRPLHIPSQYHRWSTRRSKRTSSRSSSTRTSRAVSSSVRRGAKGTSPDSVCQGFQKKIRRQITICVSRSVPEGTKQWEFEFPFVTFIKVGEKS